MALNETSLVLRSVLIAFGLVTAIGAKAQVTAKAESLTVSDQVSVAFRFGDFAELERLYAINGKPGVRSPLTGTERVTHFWRGIRQFSNATLPVTEGYYSQIDALSRKWTLDYPQSGLAKLLYAESLRSHAWFHRGVGYSNTVVPASWDKFYSYLNLALEHLRRNEALFAKDSSWDLLVLRVGRDLGWRIDQLMPILESGITKNPDHDDLYFEMQFSMMPKWGGDLASVERFIASVTQKTREKRGMEMYARLYAVLSYSEVKQALFSATQASWPMMKKGFEDRLSRHPHSDHRNMYAYFACMAQDRQVLQEQLRLMDGAFDRAFWGEGPERNFEECKAFAGQL